MAFVAKVSITYTDTTGTNRTLSYKGTKTYFSSGVISTICSSLKTNGSIMKYPVAEIVGAKLVTTVEEELDLEE